MKDKFYAVQKGRHPGVYQTWDECRRETNGFPGTVFKSFYTYKVIIQRKSFQSNSTKVKQRTIQRRITNTTMFLYMYLKMVLCLLITITNEKTLMYTQK